MGDHATPWAEDASQKRTPDARVTPQPMPPPRTYSHLVVCVTRNAVSSRPRTRSPARVAAPLRLEASAPANETSRRDQLAHFLRPSDQPLC